VDAHMTEHHHSSPDLPPLPRVKSNRACELPNIQSCQTLVETGLPALSALEKLTDQGKILFSAMSPQVLIHPSRIHL